MVFSTTVQHLIAGTSGGLVATAALYPLELIKTRMQVIDTKDQIYRHFVQSVRTVVREEGVVGLYQGMSPALFAASGSWGGYFYFYEKSKARKLKDREHLNCNTEQGKKEQLTSTDHLLSGIEAGVILVFMFNPFWVVKTRLALQGAENIPSTHRRYTGMIDALVTMSKEEGIRGLYKGLVPALLLTSHGAIQFAIYERMKSFASSFRIKEDKHQQPPWVSFLIGGSSKIFASTITYPYQVVKSRLQQRDFAETVQSLSSTNNKEPIPQRRYNGTIDCMVKIWKRDGPAGFFRGVVPNVLKVAPSAALTFLIYEETMKLMKDSSVEP